MQRKQEPMPEPNDESFDKTKKVKPLIAKVELSQELQETEKEEQTSAEQSLPNANSPNKLPNEQSNPETSSVLQQSRGSLIEYFSNIEKDISFCSKQSIPNF
tara:strand:- start:1152 stop:1457 length:306 start_codon:yes stop_codon:yes gene_type:complete